MLLVLANCSTLSRCSEAQHPFTMFSIIVLCRVSVFTSGYTRPSCDVERHGTSVTGYSERCMTDSDSRRSSHGASRRFWTSIVHLLYLRCHDFEPRGSHFLVQCRLFLDHINVVHFRFTFHDLNLNQDFSHTRSGHSISDRLVKQNPSL